jgi:hypothetical protein
MVGATQEAANEAFRYLQAVPEDKLEWKPSETGRTALDMAREMARTPVWAHQVIAGGGPEWSEEGMKEEQAIMAGFATVQDCQDECNRQLEALYELYRSLPDEKLKETKWLPFNGGREHTFQEMMDYPRWNFNYHTGQVAYIQTLYGDKDMH